MNSRNHKGKGYIGLISLIAIVLTLGYLQSLTRTSFQSLKTSGIEAPILQDDGPTDDGSTSLKITNSIPNLMVFTMTQGKAEAKNTVLKSCPQCKIYAISSDIPKNVCTLGTTETFVVRPGSHDVRWSHPGANISNIAATWTVKPGRKYSVCVVMDLSRGRSDWSQK